jgi:indolepyruvate ferredoxin oxidoreductase beta subunit
MRDGRVDEQRLLALARRFARHTLMADFAAPAAAARAPLNAVLLGALAGAGVLPIAPAAFRAAVRDEGKAVEANLRGFETGLAPPGTPAAAASPEPLAVAAVHLARFPVEARAVLADGIKRLTDYQDAGYAERYLARVGRFLGRPHADGVFLRELARHLALRMSVEDVIRVAQLKVRAARLALLVQQARVGSGDIVDVTEFLKPGPEEIFGLLPPRLGRALLARLGRNWGWAMQVRTSRLPGFLALRLLGALRRWRPSTLRFAEENAWVERWLDLVDRTLAIDAAAAREVVTTAELVRGYGDTYRRGLEHWHSIREALIEPTLAGRLPRATFADAVLQARLAASLDPAGAALTRTLAAVGAAGARTRSGAQPAAP